MNRAGISTAKRIVIKIGSSSLTGSAGSQLDPSAVDSLADLVANARQRGAEVCVVSSGAIAAGLAPLGLKVRPKDLATQQAAASGAVIHLRSRVSTLQAWYQVLYPELLSSTILLPVLTMAVWARLPKQSP